jgi:hypothetical protein
MALAATDWPADGGKHTLGNRVSGTRFDRPIGQKEATTMSTNTPHGAHGCFCEDCLGTRIRLAAELAQDGRQLVPLWARQRRFRVRLASDVMTRRAS